jgi:uncharacterized protein YndB with AHSA1/START domain
VSELDLRAGFSRFLSADPDRLDFAAHSHHPWPDVTFAAHEQAWLDAARLVDDKWERVFGEVVPEARLVYSWLDQDDLERRAFRLPVDRLGELEMHRQRGRVQPERQAQRRTEHPVRGSQR